MKREANCLATGIFLAAIVNGFGQLIITVQPGNKSVSLGASVTNRVSASGTAPITYQWRFNAADLTGATNTSLVLTNVQTAKAGGYDVVAADMFGSATSRVATLEVDPTFTKIT